MNMRPILNAVAAAGLVAVAGAPGPAWADDAEIYVNQRDLPEASQPLVMFSLDYRLEPRFAGLPGWRVPVPGRRRGAATAG
jgi:hypothetical protein